jgi:beta-N-acetylhexosaminidase
MEGASIAGDMLGRVQAAWDAGCDMMPVCNVPEAVGQVLAAWRPVLDPERSQRIARLLPAGEIASPDILSLCTEGRRVCQTLV